MVVSDQFISILMTDIHFHHHSIQTNKPGVLQTWTMAADFNSQLKQGLPFPTARRPWARETTSRVSGFEQIFPLYFI